MQKRWLPILLISFLIFELTGPLLATDSIPDPSVLNQETSLKEYAERQAQAICDSILGRENSSVLVNVELGIESSQKGGAAVNRKLDSKDSLGDESFILPWVPAPKSVTKEEVPKDASIETQAAQQSTIDVKTVVRRFDITVIHDAGIPEPQIEAAKAALESAFSRYKNVIKIFFQASKFVRTGGFDAKETVKKNLFNSLNLKNFLFLFLLLLAFFLLRFFFGPLADFMKEYINGMKEQAKSKVEMENKSENENDTDAENDSESGLEGQEGELSPAELAELEEQEAMMEEKFEPFNYVNDDNVKQLAYLLHHEEPWIVALVISYLTAEHAYKVMEALPADLQAKVALETAMYRQTSLDQVITINDDIREKIDFVVGGLGKLIGILESSDRFARDNILEYLKNEKPGLYEKVREQILLFDDIAKFPKMAMQVLVRELKTEELGRSLRGTSPELQQVFFDNMSQGAVALLKEEIEYGPPATNDQIEEERKKIIDMVKQMEIEGKISFRQKSADSALSGDEMGASTPGVDLGSLMSKSEEPVNPEEAAVQYESGNQAMEQEDTQSAIQFYELAVENDSTIAVYHQGLAGAYYAAERFEDAVVSYDKGLAIEPNPEMQEWVDQLRQSLSAAA